MRKFIFVLLTLLLVSPFSFAMKGIIWQPQNRDSQVTDTQWQGLMSQLRLQGFDTLVLQWTRYGDAFTQPEQRALLFKRATATQQADLNWRSEAARQPLLTWLNNAQRLISDVSAKPVYISIFFAGNMSPDGYRQLLEQVKATGVNVWVQDGSGVDKLTAEQRERYLQASADCQSSAPASGIVYELFVAGKGKTFTAKPKPDAEIASLLAKRSSCGKDTLYFSLRYLPVAQSILEY